ncbi:MAG: 50S ribosomal protein L23 [Firmicutes bacterium]|nr:50S ribosomal protein L23 [Bacillota bacterium]
MSGFDIILKPVLSEKTYALIGNKRYAFKVALNATKPQIKKAVEEVFKGVRVEKVNTVKYDGKYKRQGKHEGYTPKYKKAYVQLTKDSKAIEFFESLQ